MLDFLMRLQDGTQERGFDYVICGIDEIVMLHNRRYMQAVGDEMVRTMRIGGIIIGGATFPFRLEQKYRDMVSVLFGRSWMENFFMVEFSQLNG
jgi:hypothetical protein